MAPPRRFPLRLALACCLIALPLVAIFCVYGVPALVLLHNENGQIRVNVVAPEKESLPQKLIAAVWPGQLVRIVCTLKMPKGVVRPFKVEVRGSSPDGPVLGSATVWNPGPEAVVEAVKFNVFTGWHSVLVIGGDGLHPNVHIDETSLEYPVASAYQELLSPGGEGGLRAWFLLWGEGCALAIWTLLGPLGLWAAVGRGRIAHRLDTLLKPSHWSWIGVAVLAVVAVLMSIHFFNVVVENGGLSYCNGRWSGYASFIMSAEGYLLNKKIPLIPLDLWPPGFHFFFASILFAAKAVSGSASFFTTEVSYRIVQVALIWASLSCLFMFLVQRMREAELPGWRIIPLVVCGVLAADPELFFAYVTPTQHALFVPIYIAFVIMVYRLVYCSFSLKRIIYFGFLGFAAILWRDEMQLVPFIFLGVYVLLCGFSKKSLATATLAGIVVVAPLLIVMAINRINYGYFAYSRGDHGGIALMDYLGEGYPDNALGIINEDCHNVRLGYWLNPEPAPAPIANGRYMKRFFFDSLFKYPGEYMKSWRNRLGHNMFSFASVMLPGECPNIQKRMSAFLPVWHNGIIWHIYLLGGLLAPLAVLGRVRGAALFHVPALYALGVVGFLASGNGYFSYGLLSSIVLAGMGMGVLLGWSRKAMAAIMGLAGSENGADSRLRSGTGEFVVGLVLTTALALVTFLGLSSFDMETQRAHFPRDINAKERVERIRDGIVAGSPRIQWARGERYGTYPFLGGGLDYWNGRIVYVNSSEVLEVDAQTGDLLNRHPIFFPNPCVSTYLTRHGKTVYITAQDANGVPAIEIIELGESGNSRLVPLRVHAYSPLVVDARGVAYSGYVPPVIAAEVPRGEPKYRVIASPLDGAGEGGWISGRYAAWSGLASWRDLLLVGTYDHGRMAALNRRDGSVAWEYQGHSSVFATPILDGPHVYFGDNTGHLYVLEAESGRLVRDGRVGSGIVGLVKSGDTLYTSTLTNTCLAVDAATLTPKWSFSGEGFVFARVGVRGDSVYVGAGTWLHKLSADTGEEFWRIDLGDYIRDILPFGEASLAIRCTTTVYRLEDEP